MKKVIYSIVTALIFSIILASIFPTRFLTEDARWTYQNDAARMDVKFNGHLKSGRVSAKCAGLRVTQPAWLSMKSHQGTVIEIPVSYWNRTCQIKLTPQAEEWGKDAVLIMELKGKDFQHRGKRRPAWVNFRNITLNGQPVAGEKIVWHDKPFVLKYFPHSSAEITLTFDVRKPFAASDIDIANPLAVSSAFLLLCLFFAPLKRVAELVLTFTNRKDIVQVMSDGYLNIDPVCRRSFWIIFGVLCFAFGFHTICFMWGNENWSLLDHTRSWLSRAWEGRYMVCSVKVLLSNGIYLPFIHDTIVFVTLALNAVLLCMYWRLEKRITYFVLCGLVLTVQPFTLSMMYFVNMTPEVFIGVTCALVALVLSEKIASLKVSLIRKIVYSLIAIVLINFALAMYPVLINTIAVAFVGRLLVQSFDWDGSRQQLSSYIRPCMVSVTHIMLGIVSYKLIVTYVFPIHRFYNTEMLPLNQLSERLGVLLRQCFQQLCEYNMPFLPQWILWTFLAFTIILILFICSMGNIKQKVVRLFILFVCLFATQTAMIIAKLHLIRPRVEIFGLVFFEVLILTVVFTRIKKLHNLSVIAASCVISASVLQDLDCLRVWKLGFDAEKMLWNRVLARMETQKDFDPTKKYDVVRIGSPTAMRPRYYTKLGERHVSDRRAGASLLYASYEFSSLIAPEFYYPSRFRGQEFSTGKAAFLPRSKPGYVARLKRLYQAGVLQKAEVWPKPNGLIVWKNIILIVTDGKELEKYRKQFERELGKK